MVLPHPAGLFGLAVPAVTLEELARIRLGMCGESIRYSSPKSPAMRQPPVRLPRLGLHGKKAAVGEAVMFLECDGEAMEAKRSTTTSSEENEREKPLSPMAR